MHALDKVVVRSAKVVKRLASASECGKLFTQAHVEVTGAPPLPWRKDMDMRYRATNTRAVSIRLGELLRKKAEA